MSVESCSFEYEDILNGYGILTFELITMLLLSYNQFILLIFLDKDKMQCFALMYSMPFS